MLNYRLTVPLLLPKLEAIQIVRDLGRMSKLDLILELFKYQVER